MSRFFMNGGLRQELVQSFVTDDMIVLATIERANVEAGGLPAQDWALRVTSVIKPMDPAAFWRIALRPKIGRYSALNLRLSINSPCAN